MAPPANQQRPYVGVGVIVIRRNPQPSSTSTSPSPTFEFIIGKRLGSHGANSWALPGGHLEFNETFEQCAAREVLEETGLDVHHLRYLTATNDVMHAEGKHYVTVFVVCERRDPQREPVVCEKDKCAGWEWVGWDEVREWAVRQRGRDADRVEGGEQGRDGEMEKGTDRGELFLPLLNLVLDREDDVLAKLSSSS